MRSRRIFPKTEDAIEYVPSSVTQTLEFRELFSNEAPVEIDLGCGDGLFLATLAAENPHRNYLGIERLLGRVRSACHKAAKLDLGNVRVLRMDITYAVTHLISPASVSQFHLLFPDPWPKRRHHRRRIMTHEFATAIHRALTPDGSFQIATDQTDYFQHIKHIISPFFVATSAVAAFPKSTFEKRFAQLTIYRLRLRKISSVR